VGFEDAFHIPLLIELGEAAFDDLGRLIRVVADVLVDLLIDFVQSLRRRVGSHPISVVYDFSHEAHDSGDGCSCHRRVSRSPHQASRSPGLNAGSGLRAPRIAGRNATQIMSATRPVTWMRPNLARA